MTLQRRRAMPWAPARLASSLPLSCSAIAASLAAMALSACGGGGSNTLPPDAEVTPSTVVSTSAYLHMQRNRVDDSGNFVAQDIVLVDPVTAAAVWQQTVEITSTQAAVHAFTVSPDGLTYTEGADQALYYSQGGKLYELSLKTGSTPVPRQVSSEAGTCSVVRAVPTNTTASLAWVLVNTAGTDGLCDTTNDNVLKLVRSDAASTTAALSWRGGALDAIDIHRNASGTLTQLIAFDPVAGQVVAISATDGSVSNVSGGALGTGTSVSYLGRAAGRRDQIYVVTSALVHNTTSNHDEDQTRLRTLTWASDTAAPTLGNVASPPSGGLQQSTTALSSATLNFAHTDDATGFYFVDGLKVNVIDKGKATMRTLAILPAPAELLDDNGTPIRPIVLPGGALGSTALALPVVTAEGVKMVSVAKATGAQRSFDLAASTTALTVEARQGDDLVISQLLGDVGGPVALWRASLSAGTGAIATTAVSARAHVLGAMRDTAESLSGEAANPALVWCEAATTCTAPGLKSLQLSGGHNLALAGADAASFEWTSHTVGDTSGKILPITVGTQQLSGVQAGLWASDSLWLLDATVAGSLKQVTLLTPAPQ